MIAVLLAALTCHYHAGGALPDPACTPGALNPAVTQTNIAQTICRKGWTATIRPPVTFTEALKRRQLVEYGQKGKSLSLWEEDHLLPLELGGSPGDPLNLWPEPHAGRYGAYRKDGVENHVRALVCNGSWTLVKAQNVFLTDWRKGQL